MKHDYMTDRNWKLDEEQAPPPSKASSKSLVLGVLIIVVAIFALLAWRYIKHEHTVVAMQSEIIQTAPVSSPEIAASTTTAAKNTAASNTLPPSSTVTS